MKVYGVGTMKIIVPSAKIVSEDLQNIGKLPSVIYPVTDKIVFDFLHQQYLTVTSTIKVLCYEHAEKVHRKLKKYKNTEVVDIPELRDLANTVYYGIEGPEPVILNFGDTIVFDNIFDGPMDSFFILRIIYQINGHTLILLMEK